MCASLRARKFIERQHCFRRTCRLRTIFFFLPLLAPRSKKMLIGGHFFHRNFSILLRRRGNSVSVSFLPKPPRASSICGRTTEGFPIGYGD